MNGGGGRDSRNLVRTLVLACFPYAKATGWAFSDNVTVIPGANISTFWTSDPQIVTCQAYKSYYHTGSSSPYEREIWFDFGSSKTVETVDVMNYYNN